MRENKLCHICYFETILDLTLFFSNINVITTEKTKVNYLSLCIIKLIVSNKTAFFALECCTFFDFGGSCALFKIVSKHSFSLPRTPGSSARNICLFIKTENIVWQTRVSKVNSPGGG